ncbi:MAG TPA: YcxB family protein [Thermoanaerobaculia bacterium]
MAAVVWVWYWPRYVIAHARSHMTRRELPCLRGRHAMEAAQQGLSAECDITHSTERWAGISAVAESATHIFVMLNDVQGYVVPKGRVTDGDVGAFLTEMNQYRGRRTV